MGWYFRKSFNAGPFKLNLSRSGLGASFGVKGLRVGAGPRGSYVHVGAGGLYYRQSLDNGNNKHNPAESPSLDGRSNILNGLQEIESADVANLTDVSSELILKELNRVKKHIECFPILLVLIILCFWFAFSAAASAWFYYIAVIVSIPALLFVRHNDVTKGTAILRYDLDPKAEQVFEVFKDAFQTMSSCSRVWHIEAEGDTFDWKRSGGANKTVRRKTVIFSLAVPARVQSNIKVPMLPAGKQIIYFFPDRALVYAPNGVGVVSYAALNVEISSTKFIENESVPRDAVIVDKTWQYVNKKGGPDRRFNNNREIPVAKYEEMHLKSETGLNELFMLSRVDVTIKFADTLKSLILVSRK